MACLLVAASAAVGFLSYERQNGRHKNDMARLESACSAVQKRLGELDAQIERRLEAFAEVVAGHKEFSLRMLVENDRSSPVVTEMAPQFMKPMGFGVLEIVDSTFTILSSGHFPANRGNSSGEKVRQLRDAPALCSETIMGRRELTLQSRKRFTIADFPFYAVGGLPVDTALLGMLSPGGSVRLLLHADGEYLGMDSVASISEIKDNHIIVNDQTFLCRRFDLPAMVDGNAASLFVLVEK